MTILEITDKVLSENDPHPTLFVVLKDVLRSYNNTLIDPKLLFWYYECALLSNLGFQPNLEDPNLSGLVLPDIKLDSNCIIILSTMLSGEIKELSSKSYTKETSSLISNYLWSLMSYHFEGLSTLKSFSVVKKLLL